MPFARKSSNSPKPTDAHHDAQIEVTRNLVERVRADRPSEVCQRPGMRTAHRAFRHSAQQASQLPSNVLHTSEEAMLYPPFAMPDFVVTVPSLAHTVVVHDTVPEPDSCAVTS